MASPSRQLVRGTSRVLLVLVMVVTQLRPEADTPGPAATPPEAVPGSEGLAPLNAARGGAPQIPPRRARKAQLSILRNSSEVTPEGSLRVFGEVQNSGEGTAVQARVRVTLVDEMGTEIASREVDLIPSVLAPDTLSSFETVLPGEAQEGTIKLEVSWVS